MSSTALTTPKYGSDKPLQSETRTFIPSTGFFHAFKRRIRRIKIHSFISVRIRSLPHAAKGVVVGRDFPMVCASCLGPDSYVRMLKTPNGGSCRISKRPFNSFAWRPKGAPEKTTVICYEVAAEKNLCQACMTDLVFGLPVAVRDAFLKEMNKTEMMEDMPKSDRNRDHFIERKIAALAKTGDGAVEVDATQSKRLLEAATEYALRLGDKPLRKRYPNVCKEWLDGDCRRGSDCRHRPCNGVVDFPELSSRDAETLITRIQKNGSSNVRAFPKKIKLILLNSRSGRDKTKTTTNRPPAEKRKAPSSTRKSSQKTNPPGKTIVITGVVISTTTKSSKDVVSDALRVALPEANVKKILVLKAKKTVFVEFNELSDAKEAVSLSEKLIVDGRAVRVDYAKKSS